MKKLLDDQALEPLVDITSDIINTEKIPNSFKISIITTIYKKGILNNVENYRPISILIAFLITYLKK